MTAGAAVVIQLRLIIRDVTIGFISVVKIKCNDLVDNRQFQCGELAKNHFGRETLIIVIDEMVKSDPVPDQADFPIGVPVQTRGQQPDQRVGGDIRVLSGRLWPLSYDLCHCTPDRKMPGSALPNHNARSFRGRLAESDVPRSPLRVAGSSI
jgi:hypothetical protein